MGLDVTAYENAVRLDIDVVDYDVWPYPDGAQALVYDYAEQPSPLFSETSGEWLQGGVEPGFYSAENEYSFRAGSYGGYNQFRSELAFFAEYRDTDAWRTPELYQDYPFYELVNFSDCEGYINTENSGRLYEDFVEHHQAWVERWKDTELSDYYIEKYVDWMTAFDYARKNGFVDFH